MKRFESGSYHSDRLVLLIFIFTAFIALFTYCTDSFSEGSLERQKNRLEAAINKAVVYSYAVDGCYPENLEYIVSAYGITFDTSKFSVIYNPIGANIYPDITILEAGGRH